METTIEVYKVLDHLITGKEFIYTIKDLKEAKVSKANLEIALNVLIDMKLVRKTRIGYQTQKSVDGYQFMPRGKERTIFLRFYNRVLKEIQVRYEVK